MRIVAMMEYELDNDFGHVASKGTLQRRFIRAIRKRRVEYCNRVTIIRDRCICDVTRRCWFAARSALRFSPALRYQLH